MREGQRFCGRCGHELRPAARFCGNCGHSVPGNVGPTAARGSVPDLAAGSQPEPDLPSYGPTITTAPGLTPPRATSGGGRGGAALPGAVAPAISGRERPPPPQAAPRLGIPARGTLPRPSRRAAFPWPLALAAAVLLAVGGTAAVFLLRHSQPSAQAKLQVLSPTTGPTASSGAPPSQATREHAAQGLSALLVQSATDRSSIENAVSDVSQCGTDLSQDAQTFQSAATSRQDLLSELGNLTGRSSLPTQMLQALSSAWQASAQADQDFAQWAQDEASQGCTPNDQSDPNYQAATGPDDQATIDKKAFVSLWNPIAAQYGLPTYQWDQLLHC